MKTLREYELRLKSMPLGSHSFDYHLDSEFFKAMESTDIKGGNVDVKVDILCKHDSFEFGASFLGNIIVECDRCLGDLSIAIDTDYETTLKFGIESDYSNDEMIIISEREDAFNISELLFDTVALEVPLRKVHEDGECDTAMSELLLSHSSTLIEEQDED